MTKINWLKIKRMYCLMNPTSLEIWQLQAWFEPEVNDVIGTSVISLKFFWFSLSMGWIYFHTSFPHAGKNGCRCFKLYVHILCYSQEERILLSLQSKERDTIITLASLALISSHDPISTVWRVNGADCFFYTNSHNPWSYDRINFLKMSGLYKQEMENTGKGKGGNRNWKKTKKSQWLIEKVPSHGI